MKLFEERHVLLLCFKPHTNITRQKPTLQIEL